MHAWQWFNLYQQFPFSCASCAFAKMSFENWEPRQKMCIGSLRTTLYWLKFVQRLIFAQHHNFTILFTFGQSIQCDSSVFYGDWKTLIRNFVGRQITTQSMIYSDFSDWLPNYYAIIAQFHSIWILSSAGKRSKQIIDLLLSKSLELRLIKKQLTVEKRIERIRFYSKTKFSSRMA